MRPIVTLETVFKNKKNTFRVLIKIETRRLQLENPIYDIIWLRVDAKVFVNVWTR